MDPDDVLEAYMKIGAKYNLSDSIARDYFVKLVADVPAEMRARFLRPEWIVGFVAGMLYARMRNGDAAPDYVDARVLYRIIDKAFEKFREVPYVGDRN